MLQGVPRPHGTENTDFGRLTAMRDLIGSLLGVPATILISAGMGIALVTVVSRVRRKRTPPIRWAHLVMGAAILGLGLLLLRVDLAIVGLN